ncbi:MAG: O-antigen ligase domain-containing protein [Chloroflexi bacterium]|nr:O-antigen ligase domain-containing protein [Chloroflexota bacterium]
MAGRTGARLLNEGLRFFWMVSFPVPPCDRHGMAGGIVLAIEPMVSTARPSPHSALPGGSVRAAVHGGSAPRRDGPGPTREWITTHRITAVIVVSLVSAMLLGLVSGTVSPIVPGSVVAASIGIALAFLHPSIALAGAVGVIAILPFAVVPLRLGVAPTFLDILTAVVWAVWIMRLATGQDRVRFPVPVFMACVSTGGVLASYLASPDPLSFNETARMVAKVSLGHLIVIPAAHLLRTRASIHGLVGTVIVVTSIEAVVGIGLYLVPRDLAYRLLAALEPLGYPVGDTILRYRPDTDILRAIGTSIDPNMLGALLMIGGALATPQLLATHPIWPRPVTIALLAPIATGLLLTESRGSWLSLGAAILIVGTLRYRRLWVVIGVAGALAVFLPQAQRFTEHLLSGLQAQDRASSMRLDEIRNAYTIITGAPWIGVGWGIVGRSIDLEFTRGVSNIYLTIAQRSGMPALVAYLAVWVTIAWGLWPAIRRASVGMRDDGIVLGGIGAIGGALVAGMVDHHFVSFPHLVTLLWAVTGMVLARASGDLDGVSVVNGAPQRASTK